MVQEPGAAYTLSGTGLTMTGSIAGADDFYVVYRGKAIQTGAHPSDRALTPVIMEQPGTTNFALGDTDRGHEHAGSRCG